MKANSSVLLMTTIVPLAHYTPPSLRQLCADGRLIRGDIPIEVYHADRSCVSSTGLKHLLRSPKHYLAYLEGESKVTAARALGTTIHTRVLEPSRFKQEYVMAPTSDRRTAEFKEFRLSNADKRIVTPDEMVILEGIEYSISKHDLLHTNLWQGQKEQTIIWQDEETGLWCKIRPDCLCPQPSEGLCIDLKSTLDASKRAFMMDCVEYSYDFSAAMYLDGLQKRFCRDFDFVLAAVEKVPPFGVACYGVPEEMLARGKRNFRTALRTLKECLETNEWPGYQPNGDYDVLDWPRWAI